ncbi:hypothetical protein GCWU000324_00777 [Kingella oralis ATCC 51147]|uniref:Uncharacterized protein n=1 Tax=Kingella oralis ATCC 51147 TaxID=629741 RepID=C4GF64_9NEIS|nr:hypothetical protein GCWU000324_00777 [Kingella oralis ATCC 51147]
MQARHNRRRHVAAAEKINRHAVAFHYLSKCYPSPLAIIRQPENGIATISPFSGCLNALALPP